MGIGWKKSWTSTTRKHIAGNIAQGTCATVVCKLAVDCHVESIVEVVVLHCLFCLCSFRIPSLLSNNLSIALQAMFSSTSQRLPPLNKFQWKLNRNSVDRNTHHCYVWNWFATPLLLKIVNLCQTAAQYLLLFML